MREGLWFARHGQATRWVGQLLGLPPAIWGSNRILAGTSPIRRGSIGSSREHRPSAGDQSDPHAAAWISRGRGPPGT